MLTVKQWDDYVRFNKARADKEMCNSVQLRESILDTLQQTSSDLLAQHTATAYGYRHRLHEYSMALDELYYRKKLVSYLQPLSLTCTRDSSQRVLCRQKLAHSVHQTPGLHLCLG